MPGLRQHDTNGSAPSEHCRGFTPNQIFPGLSGMGFSIPNVPLIPQTKSMACWYASAQMLIRWRRERTAPGEASHPDPSEVSDLSKRFIDNHGLSIAQITNLAKELGLQQVPPMTPTPGAIEGWLRAHGPLWFAGLWPSGHVVVITGISSTEMEINDPWPVDRGARRKISFVEFGRVLQPLDTGPEDVIEFFEKLFGVFHSSLGSNLLYLQD